jgi:hypothetical protein
MAIHVGGIGAECPAVFGELGQRNVLAKRIIKKHQFINVINVINAICVMLSYDAINV